MPNPPTSTENPPPRILALLSGDLDFRPAGRVVTDQDVEGHNRALRRWKGNGATARACASISLHGPGSMAMHWEETADEIRVPIRVGGPNDSGPAP